MKVLAREVFIPHRDGLPAFPGFVGYVSREKPVLIHRYGWELESDSRDDWTDIYSYDNGRTWTEPVVVRQSRSLPDGTVLRYAEFAGFFDSDTDLFITFAASYRYRGHDIVFDGCECPLEIQVYDGRTGTWQEPVRINVGGLVSFCFPIKTRSGRILVPLAGGVVDENGKPMYYRDCWAPANESKVAIGEYNPDGTIRWRGSRGVGVDLERSCRGFDENTLHELPDGRIAMVIRGSNDVYPERPGYKWVSYSTDEGETWSRPVPWSYSDGEPVESSGTGSAIFRSVKTGKVYWIGNLCLDGECANGNWPRSPLYIGEVSEEPFALKRETLAIIDQRQPHESPTCQLSNFRFYQDRENGELVVFLTRFGEESEKDWKRAHYYRYRIELG